MKEWIPIVVSGTLVVGAMVEFLRIENEKKKMMKETMSSFMNLYKTQRSYEEYIHKINEELNNCSGPN